MTGIIKSYYENNEISEKCIINYNNLSTLKIIILINFEDGLLLDQSYHNL